MTTIFTIENCSREKFPGLQLAYKTYGELNASGDNAVVLPTFYTGSHMRNEGFSVLAGQSIRRAISSSR